MQDGGHPQNVGRSIWTLRKIPFLDFPKKGNGQDLCCQFLFQYK